MLKSIVKNIVKSELDKRVGETHKCVIEGLVRVITKK